MLHSFSIGFKSGEDASHSIKRPFLMPKFIKWSSVFLFCHTWISSVLMPEASFCTMAQSRFSEILYRNLRSASHLLELGKDQPAHCQLFQPKTSHHHPLADVSVWEDKVYCFLSKLCSIHQVHQELLGTHQWTTQFGSPHSCISRPIANTSFCGWPSAEAEYLTLHIFKAGWVSCTLLILIHCWNQPRKICFCCWLKILCHHLLYKGEFTFWNNFNFPLTCPNYIRFCHILLDGTMVSPSHLCNFKCWLPSSSPKWLVSSLLQLNLSCVP